MTPFLLLNLGLFLFEDGQGSREQTFLINNIFFAIAIVIVIAAYVYVGIGTRIVRIRIMIATSFYPEVLLVQIVDQDQGVVFNVFDVFDVFIFVIKL